MGSDELFKRRKEERRKNDPNEEMKVRKAK